MSSQSLSAHVKQEIDAWVKKFPEGKQKSALLMALRIVQEDNAGHLTRELMDLTADYLKVDRMAAYEVAGFYTMYNHKPVGKYRINVCNAISCYLCGSEKLMDRLKDKLGVEEGEVTEDGLFSWHETECLASCVRAPAVQINDERFVDNLGSEASVDDLINLLRKESEADGT